MGTPSWTLLVLALCPLHSSVLYHCVFKQIHVLIRVSYFPEERRGVKTLPLGTSSHRHTENRLLHWGISLFFTFETHTFLLSFSPKGLEFFILQMKIPFMNFNQAKSEMLRMEGVSAERDQHLVLQIKKKNLTVTVRAPLEITQQIKAEVGQEPKCPDFQPRVSSTRSRWPLYQKPEGVWVLLWSFIL